MSVEDTAELGSQERLGEPLCELCGSAIEDLEALIHLRAADLVERWERADPRDAWRHTGEKPRSASGIPKARPESYRTPQSTIDAFWFVARNHDDVYLAAWLKRHPANAAFLMRLWEAKNARKP